MNIPMYVVHVEAVVSLSKRMRVCDRATLHRDFTLFKKSTFSDDDLSWFFFLYVLICVVLQKTALKNANQVTFYHEICNAEFWLPMLILWELISYTIVQKLKKVKGKYWYDQLRMTQFACPDICVMRFIAVLPLSSAMKLFVKTAICKWVKGCVHFARFTATFFT